MFNFNNKTKSPKNDVSKTPHDEEAIWSVVANVKKEIPYGPNGSVVKSGLKKFKAGAKVHVIGAYYGLAEHVVVIGQHRQSGKYISCVVKANAIENLRVKKIYSKRILELLKNGNEHNTGEKGFASREEAEELAILIPKWVLN